MLFSNNLPLMEDVLSLLSRSCWDKLELTSTSFRKAVRRLLSGNGSVPLRYFYDVVYDGRELSVTVCSKADPHVLDATNPFALRHAYVSNFRIEPDGEELLFVKDHSPLCMALAHLASSVSVEHLRIEGLTAAVQCDTLRNLVTSFRRVTALSLRKCSLATDLMNDGFLMLCASKGIVFFKATEDVDCYTTDMALDQAVGTDLPTVKRNFDISISGIVDFINASRRGNEKHIKEVLISKVDAPLLLPLLHRVVEACEHGALPESFHISIQGDYPGFFETMHEWFAAHSVRPVTFQHTPAWTYAIPKLRVEILASDAALIIARPSLATFLMHS